MPFVNDIAGDLAWLTPAPIGYVEAGWSDIVADLLRDIGRAVAAHPTASVDVLDITERDGALRCDLVVDGVHDAAVDNAVEAAVEGARRRAASTCVRCGGPGHLRRDRAAWPTTRCDSHVVGTRRSA